MKIEENDANPEVAVPLDSNKIVVFWQVDKEKVTTEDIKQVQVVASRVGAGRGGLLRWGPAGAGGVVRCCGAGAVEAALF